MELAEYEQRKSLSRHIEVKVVCENCGSEFWHKWSRVKKGQGRFCSLSCFNRFQLGNAQENRGKEHAHMWFDETTGIMRAIWKETDGTSNTTTYARWLYEQTYGSVPDGHRCRWRDENQKNCVVENLELISSEQYSKEQSIRLMGHVVSDETKKKISMSHTGKSKWDGFVYDYRYPGFSKWIKKKVRERDSYTCQVCSKDLRGTKNHRVHHIDGNKKNSSEGNLILVCSLCHSAIHGRTNMNTKIIELRSKLE